MTTKKPSIVLVISKALFIFTFILTAMITIGTTVLGVPVYLITGGTEAATCRTYGRSHKIGW